VTPGEYLVRGVLLTDAPGGLASATYAMSLFRPDDAPRPPKRSLPKWLVLLVLLIEVGQFSGAVAFHKMEGGSV
jgi:hypothetical protein